MNDEIEVGKGLMAQINRKENIYGSLTLESMREALNDILESRVNNNEHENFPCFLTGSESFNFELKTKTTKEKIKRIKI